VRAEEHSLLDRLVAVLVSEWGHAAVSESVRRVAADGTKKQRQPSSRRNDKPSATELVRRADVPEARREVLAFLAQRFDEKAFLPRMADVREFLEMRGEQVSPSLKNRADAFRPVLRLMLRLPEAGLERLAVAPGYSGPAQLDTIAEAMRAAGERLRPDDPASD
jgi:hypothetical protein